MSINQRQFEQLTEMGISLWQRRSLAFEQHSSNKTNTKQEAIYLEYDNNDLADLATQVIFTDILLSIGLSIGEVNLKQNHLDLGLFNWYFSLKSDEQASIHCLDNNLVSPCIKSISQSPALKKQLWQTISNNLL